jgi:hypothetical protein
VVEVKRTLTLLAMAVVLGLTGCERAVTPTPTGSPTPPGGQSAAPTGSPTNTAASPATWSSQPVAVNKTVTVPPVPRLTAIRSGQHSDEGYDRVVFDFVSVLPGYDVRYVDTVTADGSGQPVTVPGQRHLKIVFRPTQAHDDSGGSQVARSATLDLPMLKAYAITGDFEGVVTVVLGLNQMAGFRIVELPGTPGRVAIDVAT